MFSPLVALSKKRSFLNIAVLSGAFYALSTFSPAQAQSVDTREIVAESRYTIEKLKADKEFANVTAYIDKARAVLIIPQLIKAGFLIGGEGGTGVLLVKGADGSWSNPAFYTLAAGSIGLQMGGSISEVVFTFMSESAVLSILDNEIKLGADLSVAVGPLGRGLEAATTTDFNADVYAFSRTIGLFGGGAFEGAKLFERTSYNTDYYGAEATPHDITIGRKYNNPDSAELRRVLQ